MISMEERTEIIKASVKTVNGAFPIIVGTGTIETQKVIALSKHAMECGADATLIITPYYVKPPQRALVKHYLSIADSVALPMIVYNCPGRTGVDMKPETIAEFSNHPMIIGVKDATGDINRVASLRQLCGKSFLLFSGEDDLGCEFVRVGGDGVISVTANVAPSAMHRYVSSENSLRVLFGITSDALSISSYVALYLSTQTECLQHQRTEEGRKPKISTSP
jgi:4-hydroxy-tetrahydrodipicolinate synthase